MYKNLKFLPSVKFEFLFLLLNPIIKMEKSNYCYFLKVKEEENNQLDNILEQFLILTISEGYNEIHNFIIQI